MGIDEAKLAEITMLVPGRARTLAERLGLKRVRRTFVDDDIPDLSTPYWRKKFDAALAKRIQPKTPLSPLAARLLAIGMAAAQVR
jgi:hypothetical protein